MPGRAFWMAGVASVLASPFAAAQDRAEPRPVVGRAPHAEHAGWSIDSSTLFTTGRFGSLTAWRFSTTEGPVVECRAERVERLPDHVNSMTVGRRTSLIVVGTNDGTAEIREPGTFQLRRRLEVGTDYSVYAVAISPDERWLAACGTDGSVCLWDLKNQGERIRLEKGSREGERMAALEFSPDGQALVSLSRYGRMVVWDTATARETAHVDLTVGEDSEVQFSRDGQRILALDRHVLIS